MSRTTTKVELMVRLTVPTGSNVQDVTQYVRDAVQFHKGGLDSKDPLFLLNPDEIAVKLLRKETLYA